MIKVYTAFITAIFIVLIATTAFSQTQDCQNLFEALPNIPVHDGSTGEDRISYYKFVLAEMEKHISDNYDLAKASCAKGGISINAVLAGIGYTEDERGYERFRMDLKTRKEAIIYRLPYNPPLVTILNDAITNAINMCVKGSKGGLYGYWSPTIDDAEIKYKLKYVKTDGMPKVVKVKFKSAFDGISWNNNNTSSRAFTAQIGGKYGSDVEISIRRDSVLFHKDLTVSLKGVSGLSKAETVVQRDIQFREQACVDTVPPEGPFTYTITTLTGAKQKHSSDDVFYCRLNGEKGWSKWMVLDHLGDDRKKNSKDEYSLSVKKDLGMLQSIQFKARPNAKHKKQGKKEADYWMMSGIAIKDHHHGGFIYRRTLDFWIGDMKPPMDKEPPTLML